MTAAAWHADLVRAVEQAVRHHAPEGAGCSCGWSDAHGDLAQHIREHVDTAFWRFTVPADAPKAIAMALSDPESNGSITERSAAAIFELVRRYDRTGDTGWTDPDYVDMDEELLRDTLEARDAEIASLRHELEQERRADR